MSRVGWGAGEGSGAESGDGGGSVDIERHGIAARSTLRVVSGNDVDLAIVTMRFDAADPEALLAALSKYVVLTRREPGCRNVDLCASVTSPGRYLVIQKWDSPEAQRRHFDSEVMVDMARACTGILVGPPDIDLWDGPSAHDLR